MYIVTKEELAAMKACVDRLTELRMLLPGAVEYMAQGNEYRREFLLEMIENTEKPEDLNRAISEALGELLVILAQIKS